ncbi:MAG: hypothetical protein IPO94_07135 [Saprospiraceae bacterium]|nr:hypothetical protein [Saprospiraceae bacterium]
MKSNIKFNWSISVLTIMLNGILTFICLSEYYLVGILKNTKGYPFGGEGSTPWYYKTAEMYANVNLGFGFVFLVSFLTVIWATLKRNNKLVFFTYIWTILLILILMVNGQER